MALSTADHVPVAAHDPSDAMTGPAGIAENLTLAEATELLDWLEGHGIHATDVCLDADGRLTVRWGG